MDRISSRRSLLAASSLVVASAPIRSLAQTTQCSAQQALDFAENMASRDGISGIARGPDTYMIQNESTPIYTNMIDATLRDFTVTATFVNPENLNKPWDFAICFHWNLGPDGQMSQMEVVKVDSTGWCYYAPWPGGEPLGQVHIETFEPTPGATTTMDLWVVESTVDVGVDEKCRVPLLELAHPVLASGVAVGTGFHTLTRQLGRKVDVKNIEVWELFEQARTRLNELVVYRPG